MMFKTTTRPGHRGPATQTFTEWDGMTIEQGAVEAVVKIRVQTRRAWIVFLVIGGCYLAMSAFFLTGGWPWFLLILIPLPIGCCIIAFALAL
jgi:hypothetical protein